MNVELPTADRVESLEELLSAAAVDSRFFGRYFFPETTRQATPDFHDAIDKLVESNNRLINIQVFRGGAKTSKLRIYSMKRAVFGLSHTATIVGKSQGHAEASLQWIRNKVENSSKLRTVFRLRAGRPWTNNECVVISDAFQSEIWFKALGIDGSVRGVLKDDYRPDLILLDDPIDDENSATESQRLKIKERIHGALKESLASSVESPDAKLVMLQTPMNKEDASTLALEDPEWKSARFGIWTKETEELPVDKQVSRWPEMYPTEEVRKQKRFAAARNMLSVFVREKECRITSRETSSFRSQWLRFYDIPPDNGVRVLWIDPVPPPSESEVERGLHKKDFEVLAVVQRTGDDFYVLDYEANRGHDPSWTIAKFFEMNAKWRPMRNYVESVAYQRTLAWLLRQAMQREGFFLAIEEVTDQRPKFMKIIDGLQGIAASKRLFIRRNHTDFVSQFEDYPNVSNDDIIESIAMSCSKLSDPMYQHLARLSTPAIAQLEDIQDELDYQRGAP